MAKLLQELHLFDDVLPFLHINTTLSQSQHIVISTDMSVNYQTPDLVYF